jgi:hypothetical protein
MYGKPGRLGMSGLLSRQYGSEKPVVTQTLDNCLLFLRTLQEVAPPREIQLLVPPLPQIILYTDAEFHPEPVPTSRLGLVYMDTAFGSTRAGSIDVPAEVMNSFLHRETQIYACESFAGPVAAWNWAKHWKGRDVMWFVDNTAALSAMLKGSSPAQDVAHLMEIMHLRLAFFSCRIWLEWVDSAANPSDGLSRDGYFDKWTLAQGWSLEQLTIPPWDELHSLAFNELQPYITSA